jgi:hypothetical protein
MAGKIVEGMAQDIGHNGELIVDGVSVIFGSVIHL